MSSLLKPLQPFASKKVAKNASRAVLDPLETLNSQVTRPILDEAFSELGGFFGFDKNLSKIPKSLGSEELRRARQKQEIEAKNKEDKKESEQRAMSIRTEMYRNHEVQIERNQSSLSQEFHQLQSEVAALAKTAGVETSTHLENKPKKIGILDIKILTSVIRTLRIKAEESKSGKDLVFQRSNAKSPTGMLAWVSGKQMKIHEQGTLQLQG